MQKSSLAGEDVLTLSGLKPLRFLRFCNPNILFAQVPKLNTFAQKCVLILLVALLGQDPNTALAHLLGV